MCYGIIGRTVAGCRRFPSHRDPRRGPTAMPFRHFSSRALRNRYSAGRSPPPAFTVRSILVLTVRSPGACWPNARRIAAPCSGSGQTICALPSPSLPFAWRATSRRAQQLTRSTRFWPRTCGRRDAPPRVRQRSTAPPPGSVPGKDIVLFSVTRVRPVRHHAVVYGVEGTGTVVDLRGRPDPDRCDCAAMVGG